MATTSPDNLRTPDPSSPYNLVPDLQTLANDVQTALNLRTFRTGTAAQRTAFVSTATLGFLWQDTDSLRLLWKKGASAWEPAVWQWSGTDTQMTGFAAPDGFVWHNTTDGLRYVRTGGAWAPPYSNPNLPFAMASGTVTAPSSGTGSVTFPAGVFTKIPHITVTSTSYRFAVTTQSKTLTGFNYLQVNSAGTGQAGTLDWIAVQMTP